MDQWKIKKTELEIFQKSIKTTFSSDSCLIATIFNAIYKYRICRKMCH